MLTTSKRPAVRTRPRRRAVATLLVTTVLAVTLTVGAAAPSASAAPQAAAASTAAAPSAATSAGSAATVIPGVGHVPTAIATGVGHSCALFDDGAVKCWGNNLSGQLGLGDQFSRGDGFIWAPMGAGLPTIDLGPDRTATAIAAGGSTTCAVLDNGRVKCWGENGDGQLGLGDTADRGDEPGEMGAALPAVDLGTGRTATTISVSATAHVCALLDDGTVKCWGANSWGELGLGDTATRGDQAGEMGDALPAVDLGVGRTATKVVAAGRHSCAVLDNGSLKCWGSNHDGELGLGDVNTRGDQPGEMGASLPVVDVGAGRSVASVAGGLLHTCVVLDDASVKCFGQGALGQLGLGDTSWRGDSANQMGDLLPTVSLGTGRTATAVAAGISGVTCALLDNGSVKCWGPNNYGTSGQGDTITRGDGPNEMGDNLLAVPLGTGRTATAISTSGFHVCALLDDATVKCWGLNSSGELGLGNTAHRGDQPGEMGDALPAVDLGGPDLTVTYIANEPAVPAGETIHLRLRVDNSGDRTLTGITVDDPNAPDCERTVPDLAPGALHVIDCTYQTDDTDLGTYTSTATVASDQTDPLDSEEISVAVTSPRSMVVTRTADQRSVAAGDDIDFRLTIENTGTAELTGITVADPEVADCEQAVPDLAPGDDHAIDCAYHATAADAGTFTSAATVDSDQTAPIRTNPVSVFVRGTGVRAADVAANLYHTCVLLDDGVVKCWGSGSGGKSGQGHSGDIGQQPGNMASLRAIDLGPGRTAIAVTAGANHNCALLDDGRVKCWGFNDRGQLGLGDVQSRGDQPGEMGAALPAVDLGTGRTATAISAGGDLTCAVLDDRSVKCWGYGLYGGLGQGDASTRGDAPGEMGDNLPPVDLGQGRTVSAVSVTGFGTACALLDDGRVKCWGRNADGRLGIGNTADRGDGPWEMGISLRPVRLGTGRTATAVAVGDTHACAVLDDASLRCWGDGSAGQLGQGDTADRGDAPGEMGDALPAVAVGTGRSVTAVAVSWNRTCALLDDGSIKCWGANSVGEAGVGDTVRRGDGPGEMGDSLPVALLGTGRTAVSLAAGVNHSCAVLDDGTLKCWGWNFSGQLGQGDTVTRGTDPSQMGDNLPPIILGGPSMSVVASATETTLQANGTIHLRVKITNTGDRPLTGITVDDPNAPDCEEAVADLAPGADHTIDCTYVTDLDDVGTYTNVATVDSAQTAPVASNQVSVTVTLPPPSMTVTKTADETSVVGGDTIHYQVTIENTGGSPLTGITVDDPHGPDCEEAVPDLTPGAHHTIACTYDTDLGDVGTYTNVATVDSDQLAPVSDSVSVEVRNLLTVTKTADESSVAPGDTIHLHVNVANTGHDPLTGLTVDDPNGPACEQAVPDLDPGEDHTIDCTYETDQGDAGPYTNVATVDSDQTDPVDSNEVTVGLRRPGAAAQVAAGQFHSCAVLSNGSVKCWGENYDGRLGLGDQVARGAFPGQMGNALPAVDLGTGRTAVAITAGEGHTCALLDDATVKCWGVNSSGQLGLGDTNLRGSSPSAMGDALPAVDLGTGRTARAIAAGASHTCALLDNGRVKCWGANWGGQLGQGDAIDRGDGPGEMGDALAPVDLGAGRTAVAISAGATHTCALLDNGQVKCWGTNYYGYLGTGDTSGRGDGAGEMGDALPAVALGTGRTAVAVSAGDYHSCAVLDDGSLKCWGYGGSGQLGLGDGNSRIYPGELGDALPAVDLGPGRTVTAVSSGTESTCAALDDGHLKCWGSNGYGQLGLGDVNGRGGAAGQMGTALPAVDLGTGRTVTAVSLGWGHTCATLDDGGLKCWGYGGSGQLGQGDGSSRGDGPGEMGDALPPIVLAAPELTVTKAATESSVGVGATIHFQITIANTGVGTLTGLTVDDPNGTDCEQAVPDLAEGEDHTIECEHLTDTDDVGTYTNTATVDSDQTDARASNQVNVVVRPRMTVTKTAEEAVVAPGETVHMHITVEATGASPLTGLSIADAAGPDCEGPVPDLAVGESHTVDCTHTTALGDDGTTYRNTATVDSDQTPPVASNELAVRVAVVSDTIAVASGDAHSCAVLDDGRVKCWGNNGYGQLGLGDTVSRGDGAGQMGNDLPAVNLGPGRSATAVALGANHSCALLDDGSVKCWGSNYGGELGLGDTANRGDGPGEMGNALAPVDLGAGRTATAISAGGSVTCALLDDGSVKCWGSNNYSGQLGQGDTNPRGAGAGQMGDALPPVALGTGRTATAVVVGAGGGHVCVVLDDATLKCWGGNNYGQLGQGDADGRGDGPGEMGDALAPVSLGAGRTVTSVSGGAYHTCARLDDGSVKCWGAGYAGQLGSGDVSSVGSAPGQMGDALPTVDLGTGRTASSVVVGSEFSCAVLSGGGLKCWGIGWAGQLGQGDTVSRGDGPGEMGDALPIVDLGGGAVSAVGAGGYHVCAVQAGGSVKCWGYNGTGQLGQGDTIGRGDGPGEMGGALPPVDLGGPPPPVTVTTSIDERFAPVGGTIHLHVTVLNTGGQPLTGLTLTGATAPACDQAVPDLAVVWAETTIDCTYVVGLRDVGTFTFEVTVDSDQTGPVASATAEVEVGVLDGVTAMASGLNHVCAVLDGGEVKCWGRNDYGQLGLGDTRWRGQSPGDMGNALPAVDLGTGRTATAVAAGALHSCALLDDGSVKCWGNNSYGQLGLGDASVHGSGPGQMGDALPAVDLGPGRTATALSIGSYHTCAILDDGSVKCWGYNFGVLGLGDYDFRGGGPGQMGAALPAVDLGTGRTAVSLSAGDGHTCAVLDDGSVKCWGANWAGQLGIGDSTARGGQPGDMGDALPAVDLGPGRTAVEVTVGDYHSCAVLDDGSVRCWGYNGGGQLGLGDTGGRGTSPTQMGAALPAVDLGTGRTATAITAGGQFTCAVLDDGSAKCWGYGFNGALGQGDQDTRGSSPGQMGDALPVIDLGTGRSVVAITAGGEQVCAVLDDGTAKCWGTNHDGRLGQGDTEGRGDQPGEMGDALAPINLGGSPPPPALTVTKSADEATVDAGQTIHLHVRVENTGGTNLTGLTVSDANASDCEQALASLRVGDVHTFDCTYATTNADLGTYTNVASVDSDQLDPVESNEVSVSVEAAPPSLAVVTTADETSVDAGATVHLHVKVTNTGGVALTGLTVTDANAPDCVQAVPDLAVGADHTIDCTYATGVDDLGTYANAATVDSDQTEPVASDEVSVEVTIPSGTGVLRGHVTDAATHDPVVGALVAALDPGDYSLVGAATSGADGRYAMIAPAGSLRPYLVDPTGAHAAAFGGAGPTTVPDGAEVVVDLEMAPARGSIDGLVTDAVSGQPLADVLTLAIDTRDGRIDGGDRSAADGAYTVPGLPAAPHLVVHVDLSGAHRAQYYDGRPDPTGAATVTPSPGDATSIGVAALVPKASPSGDAVVRGRVTALGGDPIAGAAVVALSASTYTFHAGGVTDASGEYQIPVDAGDYIVGFIDPTGARGFQWHSGRAAADLGSASPVAAAVGSPAVVDATLRSSTGAVAGTVTTASSGDPLGGALVVAIDGRGTPVGVARTDADGTYQILGVPAGPTRVRFLDPSRAHRGEYHHDATSYALATVVEVSGDETTTVDAALLAAG